MARAAPGGLRWMQVYIWKDRRIVEYTIRRAEEAGYKAIVITVDSPFCNQKYGRHSVLRKKMSSFDRDESRFE